MTAEKAFGSFKSHPRENRRDALDFYYLHRSVNFVNQENTKCLTASVCTLVYRQDFTKLNEKVLYYFITYYVKF